MGDPNSMAASRKPISLQRAEENAEFESSSGFQDQDAADLARLAKTIEGEIIPRFLLAHQTDLPPGPGAAAAQDLTADDVHEFAALILALDLSRAYAFIERKRAEGRPLESIIMELLAPTASYLGELWKADRCSFTEVTVGLSRLRALLRDLSPEFESEAPGWRHGRRALLLTTPGEQHTFGLFVVEAFFRREGWDVTGGQIDSPDEVAHLVDRQWFAIAGFSLSSERFVDRLAALVRVVRRHSCNRDIGILVGGPVFMEQPDLAERVGADAFAADGRMAVIHARTLLAKKAPPS
jgi:MerR family transcriptional regulator, light-induced transcriptional regulator